MIIATDIKTAFDGTVTTITTIANHQEKRWERQWNYGDKVGHLAVLEHREIGERLPLNSVVLQAFGGQCVVGWEFSPEDVAAYLVMFGLDINKIVVFERISAEWNGDASDFEGILPPDDPTPLPPTFTTTSLMSDWAWS